jgi:hypothetical protein
MAAAAKNRIALARAVAQYPPMLARVLSAALSARAPRSATVDVNGIEAFPSRWRSILDGAIRPWE